MIASIIIIVLAFCWLLRETNYLRVRLPLATWVATTVAATGDVLIQQVLPIVVAAGVVIMILRKLLENEERDEEVDDLSVAGTEELAVGLAQKHGSGNVATLREDVGVLKRKLLPVYMAIIAYVVSNALITNLVTGVGHHYITHWADDVYMRFSQPSIPAWQKATVTDPITRKAIQVDRRTGRII